MPEYDEIGQRILDECGIIACEDGYGTTDPYWVGRYAVECGDANRDGTLN